MRYWLGCLLLMAFGVNAAEDKHTVGGMLGTTWLSLEDAREENQRDPMPGFFYDYRLHPHFAMNMTFLKAEGEQCFVQCYTGGRKAKLTSFQASVKGFLPISQNIETFARAGVARYRLEVTGNALSSEYQLPDRDDTGVDAVVAVGFQVSNRFVRVGAEWQHQRLGDDYADSLAVLVGVTF